MPIIKQSDAVYGVAVALLDRHVADPEARFVIKCAVIEYGRLEAHAGIEDLLRRLPAQPAPARRSRRLL